MAASTYFDHNATTPVDPVVLEAMRPWLGAQFGNASSRHEYGRAARSAIDDARSRVAAAVGAHPTEVIFTSGGSEANNLFIKGAAAAVKAGVLAVSAVEHPCVLRPAAQLARQGWKVIELGVDADGRIATSSFDAALKQKPQLISVMLANNETGVLQDVSAMAERALASGAIFHSDAVQALGKIPVDFRRLNRCGVHAISVSAHKIGGPKGAGALILDKRVEIDPLIAGGGQERDLRSGTENVAAIVGFGVAAEQATRRIEETGFFLVGLRNRLEQGLVTLGARLFGAGAERLPNTTCFSLPNIDGETLVAQLDRSGYAVASGAACSSAHPGPSHVLKAMGVAPETARGAVRVSLGTENTADEVDGFLICLRETLTRLHRLTAMAI